ncbi:E3 Ubiquitin-Protein Ligase Mib2 [Manis pentadactyla]|nr:E3 Ubiquitin-Protein Ligase Mib2 [Manis pentadactyla]
MKLNSVAPPRDSDSRAARAAREHRDRRTASVAAEEDARTAALRRVREVRSAGGAQRSPLKLLGAQKVSPPLRSGPAPGEQEGMMWSPPRA